MKFSYGDSWEKFPIKDGEVWRDAETLSEMIVCDIRQGIPCGMLCADMIYCDPPWNAGNVNSFVTKAGKADYVKDFGEFCTVLFDRIREICPAVCYLEIGKQNFWLFREELGKVFPIVQAWEILYYRKHPCFLLRGGLESQSHDFTGLDDTVTPETAIRFEPGAKCVGDLCTGRGLTAIAAYKQGRRFIGTELNRRRLAVAIEKANKLGGCYAP